SSVEATFDHGNLLSWIDATKTGFTSLDGPASRLCCFSATTCSSPAWFLSGNQVCSTVKKRDRRSQRSWNRNFFNICEFKNRNFFNICEFLAWSPFGDEPCNWVTYFLHQQSQELLS